MDALDGYQTVKNDQQANLNDLAGRLRNRVSQKKGRIIPFRVIGIAASVLIVCSVGVWWLKQNDTRIDTPVTKQGGPAVKHAANATASISDSVPLKPEPKSDLVKRISTPALQKKAAGQTKSDFALNSPADTSLFVRKAVTAKPTILKEVAIARPDAMVKTEQKVEPDTTPLNEMIAMGYTGPKKKDSARSPLALNSKKLIKPDTISHDQILQAKAPGVEDNNKNADVSALNKLMMHGNLGNLPLAQVMSNQTIRGQVFGKDDGLPVPGATVKIEGTNKVTNTDSKGRFELKADTGNRGKLVVAGVGYQTRKVSPNNSDSVKKIALEPSSSALSEVIVTNYTSQPNQEDQQGISARPQNGWSSYKKYLSVNAVSPDGKKGVVTLTFVVDRSGSVTQIKIIKGISGAADKKAADLVKDGPEWVGNPNMKFQKVTLRIKFTQ
jgi:hypothetical protein